MAYPSGSVVVAADGAVYVTDRFDNRILRIDDRGDVTAFAGTGSPWYSGDGGPATSAGLTVAALAVGPDGLYFSDPMNNRVRRIDEDGIVSTVAGTGQRPLGDPEWRPDYGVFVGDGGPATAAQLASPSDIAFDADGSLFIADVGNRLVREVTDGTIRTVAGNGPQRPNYSGDPIETGQQATSGYLDIGAGGIAVGSDGALYIAEYERIDRITPDGVLQVVAGFTLTMETGGERGSSDAELAENRSALEARVFLPRGIDVAGDGSVYFVAGEYDPYVRRIAPDGTIHTVAGIRWNRIGSPQDFPTGDGDLATAALLVYPRDVTIASDGRLYVVEDTFWTTPSIRVRHIDEHGVITTIYQGELNE